MIREMMVESMPQLPMSVKRTKRVHKTPSRRLEVTLPEVASVAYLNIVSDHIIDTHILCAVGQLIRKE